MQQRWEYGDTCQNCGDKVGQRRAKGLCERCYGKKYKTDNIERMRELQRQSYHRNPKKFLDKLKTRWEIRKNEAIEKMGGKCACCGETERIFLCLDHIKGGGRREYAKAGGRHGAWKRAIAEGLPPEKYRLLCWNCNSALGMHGFCPHSDLTSPIFTHQSKYSSEQPLDPSLNLF